MRKVSRPYTDAELYKIIDDIEGTTNLADLLVAAIKGMYAPLLADLGHTWDSYVETYLSLSPSDFAVPSYQLEAIMKAAIEHARHRGLDSIGQTNIGLDLINYQPSQEDAP